MQLAGIRPNLHLLKGEFIHTETGERFLALDALYEPYAQLLVRVNSPTGDWSRIVPFEPTVPAGIYRHFKHGNLYRVFGEYARPENGEVFVAYVALYEPFVRMVRPTAMWHEHVVRPDIPYDGPRFTLIRPC